MADRGEVRIKQKALDDLISQYRKAYKELSITLVDATEAGRIRKAQTMAQIRRILTELGDNVDDWVASNIPQYYRDAASVAAADLKSLGVDLSKTSSSGLINKAAIAALVDETSLAFAEGIVGMGRNARRILNDAIKRQLNFIMAEGAIKGDAAKVIAAAVKQELKQNGLSVLIDRAGKRWTFDNYADMLVRTKAVEARNLGMANTMLQYGYDLVQVSNHNSAHKECARWESEILSLTGKTPGYPTVAKAQAAGLFHPRCQHAINVINMDLAKKTKAYDNPFNTKKG